jgi:hypothetical protein
MPNINRGKSTTFTFETSALGPRPIVSGGFDYPTCNWIISGQGYGQAIDGGTVSPEGRNPRGWSVGATLLSTRIADGNVCPTWTFVIGAPQDAPLGDYIFQIYVKYVYGDNAADAPSYSAALLNFNGAVLPRLSVVEGEDEGELEPLPICDPLPQIMQGETGQACLTYRLENEGDWFIQGLANAREPRGFSVAWDGSDVNVFVPINAPLGEYKGRILVPSGVASFEFEVAL